MDNPPEPKRPGERLSDTPQYGASAVRGAREPILSIFCPASKWPTDLAIPWGASASWFTSFAVIPTASSLSPPTNVAIGGERSGPRYHRQAPKAKSLSLRH